jgi:hypothetical protein
MFFKSVKLILACTILTTSTGLGSAQDAVRQPVADPTAIIRSIVQDPAIKNFVGPSENAWDFTAPNTMLGFGPMPPTTTVR